MYVSIMGIVCWFRTSDCQRLFQCISVAYHSLPSTPSIYVKAVLFSPRTDSACVVVPIRCFSITKLLLHRQWHVPVSFVLLKTEDSRSCVEHMYLKHPFVSSMVLNVEMKRGFISERECSYRRYVLGASNYGIHDTMG